MQTTNTDTRIEPRTELHLIPSNLGENRITIIWLVQSAQISSTMPQHSIQLHIDSGANRSITNNIQYLLSAQNIKPYFLSSAGSESDIKCTAIGFLPWRSPDGNTILVKCYYSTQAI